MKQKFLLSGILIMATLSFNAHAEDATTPDKKITGGAGTCTVDVLGVSDNNATANTIATWSLNSYECAANTINIDWNPDNGGEHTQNMCYYDGAVTLPSDPVKPGYTFMGWKLVDGATTE